MMRSDVAVLAVVALAGCGGTPAGQGTASEPITISIVGTSDLHGHVERLPALAGYLDNLRAERAADGGAVVLIDAGDMFQGTLESNLAEGAPVIAAYNAMGYAAAVIGNHEFDYGPVGPADVARTDADDPRGALRARATQARFPLLAANVVDAATGERPAWDNVRSATTVTAAGVTVGIIGVTTIETPETTLRENFVGLEMRPLADAIAAQARRLRAAGADVVVVAAHAGGRCDRFDDPDDVSSCDASAEIFEVVRALPERAVDAVVAGHTHRAVAHRVNGVPVVQSYSYGGAFGRVDLSVRPGGAVTARIFPPQDVCRDRKSPVCEPYDYAGAAVKPSAEIAALLEPSFERVRALKAESLGVTLTDTVHYAYAEESALGDLFTDLMRAARPGADVALTNGGGLRANLPAGELTYGALYEALPFDNRFATVSLTWSQLAAVLAGNLEASSGIAVVSGVRADARCDGDRLAVTLTREDGTAVAPDDTLTLVTNSFLASGGDGLFGDAGVPASAVRVETGPPIREELARVLRERGGTLDAAALYDPSSPRVRYPGQRPVRCPAP